MPSPYPECSAQRHSVPRHHPKRPRPTSAPEHRCLTLGTATRVPQASLAHHHHSLAPLSPPSAVTPAHFSCAQHLLDAIGYSHTNRTHWGTGYDDVGCLHLQQGCLECCFFYVPVYTSASLCRFNNCTVPLVRLLFPLLFLSAPFTSIKGHSVPVCAFCYRSFPLTFIACFF